MSKENNKQELKPCRYEVNAATGCWEWAGAKQSNGYGHLSHKGKLVLAHRHFYEVAVGPIPAGLTIDHLCNNTGCVNPQHLKPATQYENNMRGNSVCAQNKRKTHCANGHELSGDNVKLYERPDGIRRKCRKCHLFYVKQAKAKKREAANGK